MLDYDNRNETVMENSVYRVDLVGLATPCQSAALLLWRPLPQESGL